VVTLASYLQREGKRGKEGRKVRKVVENYRFILSGDDYTAPELRRFHLRGIASWANTGEVVTSPIVSVNGRVVTTANGSVYVLGKREEGALTFSAFRKANAFVPLAGK